MILEAILIVLFLIIIGAVGYSKGLIFAGPYTKMGCYKDDPNRDGMIRGFLTGGERIDPWTPEACMANAKAAGHKYFARQDGTQCYHSNDLVLAQSFGAEPDRCGMAWNNEIYRAN